jgi:hypothetical protein
LTYIPGETSQNLKLGRRPTAWVKGWLSEVEWEGRQCRLLPVGGSRAIAGKVRVRGPQFGRQRLQELWGLWRQPKSYNGKRRTREASKMYGGGNAERVPGSRAGTQETKDWMRPKARRGSGVWVSTRPRWCEDQGISCSG